jgi:hypothetical protein
VKIKKAGKGAVEGKKIISEEDLQSIGDFMNHDYMNQPNPKKIQQAVLFYILYFFCRRGRENLHEMNKLTFEVVTEPSGEQYVKHRYDESDKNHGIDDTERNKQGRMYQNKSECDLHKNHRLSPFCHTFTLPPQSVL